MVTPTVPGHFSHSLSIFLISIGKTLEGDCEKFMGIRYFCVTFITFYFILANLSKLTPLGYFDQK